MKVRDSYINYTYGDEGFKDGNTTGNDYEYDFNGNMTKDKNKGITNIKYNHLNLPTSVVFNKGNVYGNNKIAYIYDATGVKLRKTVTEYPENTSAKKIVRTNYEGAYITKHNFNYSRNGQFWMGNDFYSGIQFISHPEGYIEPNNQVVSGGFDYVYQYKDHLGNIRLSYKDKDGDNSITGGSESIFYDDIENAGQTQSGWESIGSIHPSAAQYDNTKSLSGNYSVKIQKSSKGNFFIHSNSWLDIDPENAEYIISGWIYTEGSGTVWGDLVLFMHESGETGYFTDVAHTERVYTKGKWVYVERKVAVPNNIVKLNVRISMNSSAGGTVYFDNLSIRKVNPEQDIEIVEENNYYPFGLKHKGYNSVVNGQHYPYGYNGKEENDELGLEWLDYGFRNYDASLGRWFGVDPLAEEYYSTSPYGFVNNSPLFNLEIDGRFWIPKVNDDGSTSYIAEEGDSATTLASQYGLDQADAEAITNTEGDDKIEKNTEVSGQQVKNVNPYDLEGNKLSESGDVLKLDLSSELATDQRVFDQYMFGAEKSRTEGDFGFYTTEYYGNVHEQALRQREGFANLNIGNKTIRVNFQIPLYETQGVLFNVTQHSYFLTNNSYTSNIRYGNMFGDYEDISHNYVQSYLTFGKGRNNLKRQGDYRISTPNQNANLLNKKL